MDIETYAILNSKIKKIAEGGGGSLPENNVLYQVPVSTPEPIRFYNIDDPMSLYTQDDLYYYFNTDLTISEVIKILQNMLDPIDPQGYMEVSLCGTETRTLVIVRAEGADLGLDHMLYMIYEETPDGMFTYFISDVNDIICESLGLPMETIAGWTSILNNPIKYIDGTKTTPILEEHAQLLLPLVASTPFDQSDEWKSELTLINEHNQYIYPHTILSQIQNSVTNKPEPIVRYESIEKYQGTWTAGTIYADSTIVLNTQASKEYTNCTLKQILQEVSEQQEGNIITKRMCIVSDDTLLSNGIWLEYSKDIQADKEHYRIITDLPTVQTSILYSTDLENDQLDGWIDIPFISISRTLIIHNQSSMTLIGTLISTSQIVKDNTTTDIKLHNLDNTIVYPQVKINNLINDDGTPANLVTESLVDEKIAAAIGSALMEEY